MGEGGKKNVKEDSFPHTNTSTSTWRHVYGKIIRSVEVYILKTSLAPLFALRYLGREFYSMAFRLKLPEIYPPRNVVMSIQLVHQGKNAELYNLSILLSHY